MNTELTNKVGEAYAFPKILNQLNEQYPEQMKIVLDYYADGIPEITTLQMNHLDTVANEYDVRDQVLFKAEKTVEKINAMGDMYVGDSWDNPVEILEWLSFVIGAAIVHWQLILGGAESMTNKDLTSVTFVGLQYYESLMGQLKSTALDVGHKGARL